MERRLAAILAADVVGYARLMEHDEADTLAALKSRRAEILQPMVSKHHGRIVKVMGDGVLVEFGSAVNAVACAVELQSAMDGANAGVADDRRIILRVGINLGDVMVEGSDLYGDGVNIAARLEALAEPGSVLVSHTVFSHVKGKSKLAFEDLGEQKLKNIAEPVRLYRVSGATAPAPHAAVGKPVTPSRPSIAVLPFNNMSGNPEQGYFSDGITEDIITELSRFRQLFVIARNSSFMFRGPSVDATEVSRRLGVQYVVEGSVRRTGPRIRITAQLIDSTSGGHIWAERYDRDAEDIFSVQDDVAQSIAAVLIGRLEEAGAQKAKRKHPDSLLAYDYLLRGIECHQRGTLETLEIARQFLDRAIEIDPEFAVAHAWRALVDINAWDYDGDKRTLDSALSRALRGVEFDENDARCQIVLGYTYLMLKQLDNAEYHHRRALSLNPNDAHIIAHMSLLSVYLGNAEEGIEFANKALRLNPYPPDWYRSHLGVAHYVAGDYARAATNLNPNKSDLPWDRMYAIASHGQLNRLEEARAQFDRWRSLRLKGSLFEMAANEPFRKPADLENLLDGLRKAGMTD